MRNAGTFIGGMLLVAGSCVGAGMLALPIVTGLAGFVPSLLVFLIAWAFMTLTGLLLVEINSRFKGRVNLVSMAERALGPFGRILSWTTYLFLFYSLLVAYISGSGSLASTYTQMFHHLTLPSWVGSLVFTLLFGALAYRGTATVDYWNRFFMTGKIVFFLAMVLLGMHYVQPPLLTRMEPALAPFALPVLVIAFGYHNMIPTIMAYVQGDAKKVRKIILSGSVFALIVYLIWDLIVLGIVPVEGKWGILESLKEGRQASDAIAGILGLSWITTFAEALAFFALLSSFLAQTLALIHFLADALKVKHTKQESIPLCLLALAPPLLFSLIYPGVFIKALNFAGGICTVILFGFLPVIMAWKGRARGEIATYQLMGGRAMLLAIFATALIIFLFELIHV